MKATLAAPDSNDPIAAPLTAEEFNAVQDILTEQLNVEQRRITPDADIEADLGADSLDKVEIVMKVEERFHVTLNDDLVEPVRTVESLCGVLAKVLGR
jgi:acyl carrier protein